MNEILIYTAPNDDIQLEVKMEEDTVWLTQAQMVGLFQSSKANISEHVKNIFQSNELDEKATVRKFRTVRKDVNEETVWASVMQIAFIFDIGRSVVSRHISNILKDSELDKEVICAQFAHTT